MAIAAVPFVVCFALCAWRGEFLYLTNDDASVQLAMAQSYVDSPYPLNLISRFVPTIIVSTLYSLVPTVQWWHVYSVALVGTGAFLLTYAILLLTRGNRVRLALGVCAGLLLNLTLIAFPLCRISFTTVPAVLGAGVLAWYFASPKSDAVALRITCAALFVLTISHRQASGLVCLVFFLLTICAKGVYEHGVSVRALKKVLPFAGAIACVALLIVAGNRLIQANANSEEFKTFNSARIRYMDYPHDSYDDNPAIYDKVGWDKTLYMLVDDWCFLDDRVSAESLSYLSEHSAKSQTPVTAHYVREKIEGIQDNKEQAVVCLATLVLVTVLTLVACILCKDHVGIVFLSLSSAAAMALLWYQFVQGRILYRSLFVILMPATVLAFILLTRLLQQGNGRLVTRIAFCLALAGIVPLSLTSMRDAFDDQKEQDQMRLSLIEESINRYAIAHKPTVYVRHMGFASCTSPNALYPYDKPYNIFPWGGSQFKSDSFKAKLAKNSLDKLDGAVFKDHDAMFVSSTDLDELFAASQEDNLDNLLVRTLMWQQERYGALGIEKVDEICPGAYVYRFAYKDEPTTSYYHYGSDGLELIYVDA